MSDREIQGVGNYFRSEHGMGNPIYDFFDRLFSKDTSGVAKQVIAQMLGAPSAMAGVLRTGKLPGADESRVLSRARYGSDRPAQNPDSMRELMEILRMPQGRDAFLRWLQFSKGARK